MTKSLTGIAVGLKSLYDRVAALPIPWSIIDAEERLRESEMDDRRNPDESVEPTDQSKSGRRSEPRGLR